MKFIRRLLLFILVIIIIVGSVLYLNGNKLYKEKLSEISLENKVSSVREDSNFVKLSSLPTYYKDAVVSVEDRRFYSHGTIDFIALARATFSNIKQKDFKEGGSTITQQTAKNLYLIEEKDVSNRKVAEFLIGRDLEKKYNKDEILELYVNTIYFGDGYYGIQEASKGYFGKDAKDLTLYEATMLAGVPNAPSLYAPTVNFHLTQSRQKKVVSSMVETGTLSQEEADKLYTQIDSSTYSK
ncbi:MAG: biosynthetic peptidoglycan transglycosylase [Clostridium sp.]|nr:biosynthetic peptidoglycan transglycosylase [Clostridium sp.]